jgi:hypothetical protein
MNFSNSQGACLENPAELSSEQGYGFDRRITGVSAFPVFR